MKKISLKSFGVMLCLLLLSSALNVPVYAEVEPYKAYFVYSNTGVTAYEVDSDDKKTDSMIASTEPANAEAATIGNGFVLDGTQVTITKATFGHECYFYFAGTCSNGNILVEKDASEDIEIELQGLSLTEPDEGSCPINIKGGETRVKLKAKKGTVNVLTDAKHIDATTGEAVKPKACVNASKKLTLGGKGELTVNGNNKNGIKSDTKIEIDSGLTLNVNSVGNAISADKEVLVSDEFTGTINIDSKGKGICGTFDKEDLEDGDSWEEYNEVKINGGNITIKSTDDAIHSNRNITITAGKINLESGDDAVHADEHLVVGDEAKLTGPTINITKCYEGLESTVVDIYGGDIDIVSSDDGVNAANKVTETNTKEPIGGNTRPGGQGGKPQGGGPRADSNCKINVYGGDIYVSASTDGFDSNGNITLAGGNLVIYAAGVNSRDSNALDADGTISFPKSEGSGATVFAGSPGSQMQRTPESGGQTFYCADVNYSQGAKIGISDNGGTKEYTLPCGIKHLIYTSPTYSGGSISVVSGGGSTPTPTPGPGSGGGETGGGSTGGGGGAAGGGASASKSIASATLAEQKYSYTGKAIEVVATVLDGEGNVLKEGTDYKLEYASNVEPGEATVTVVGIGEYENSKIQLKFTIVKENTIVASLRKAEYEYNGRSITPRMNVQSADGEALVKDKDYTVQIQNNKNVGIATVVVAGTGEYKGSVELSFVIKPKKIAISSIKAGKKAATVKWKKLGEAALAQTTGYEISYDTNKSFEAAKTGYVRKNTNVSKTIKKLTSKKTYYFKMRAYKRVGAEMYYSDWSAVKKVKVK